LGTDAAITTVAAIIPTWEAEGEVQGVARHSHTRIRRCARWQCVCVIHLSGLDTNADDNTSSECWPMQADMPLEIMECFASEG
jgi:hypothetical protein